MVSKQFNLFWPQRTTDMAKNMGKAEPGQFLDGVT